MSRARLPERRRALTFDFLHLGSAETYTATLGYYHDGRIGEVFLQGQKIGSPKDVAIRDSAIAVSFALQYGASADDLRAACIHDARGRPEGPMGELLAILDRDGLLHIGPLFDDEDDPDDIEELARGMVEMGLSP